MKRIAQKVLPLVVVGVAVIGGLSSMPGVRRLLAAVPWDLALPLLYPVAIGSGILAWYTSRSTRSALLWDGCGTLVLILACFLSWESISGHGDRENYGHLLFLLFGVPAGLMAMSIFLGTAARNVDSPLAVLRYGSLVGLLIALSALIAPFL